MDHAPVGRPWSVDGRPAIEENFAVPFQEHNPKDSGSDRTKQGASSPASPSSCNALTKPAGDPGRQGRRGHGSGAAPHARAPGTAKFDNRQWLLPNSVGAVRVQEILPFPAPQHGLPWVSAACLCSWPPLTCFFGEHPRRNACTDTLKSTTGRRKVFRPASGLIASILRLGLLSTVDQRSAGPSGGQSPHGGNLRNDVIRRARCVVRPGRRCGAWRHADRFYRGTPLRFPRCRNDE